MRILFFIIIMKLKYNIGYFLALVRKCRKCEAQSSPQRCIQEKNTYTFSTGVIVFLTFIKLRSFNVYEDFHYSASISCYFSTLQVQLSFALNILVIITGFFILALYSSEGKYISTSYTSWLYLFYFYNFLIT